VGWDADDSPISVRDKTITHHIVDRNVLPSSFKSLPTNREHIQPQWIVDCSNFHVLLSCSKYAVGQSLPPHLSPFVDNEEEGYKPKYLQEIERVRNGELVEEEVSEDEMEEEEDVDLEVLVKSSSDKKEAEEESGDDADGSKEKGDEDSEEEEDIQTLQRKEEGHREVQELEAKELAKLMMSKKGKHLYDRMQYGKSKKEEQIENLRKKRDEIDTKEKSKEGKTATKQKVERLKRERRETEILYSNPVPTKKKR
jgi:pescadillo protein